MKIALIIEQLDLHKGGQERSTFEIAELLSARGLDVSIITALADNLPDNRKSRIIDLKLLTPAGFARYRIFSRLAERKIREENIDIVHAITPILAADVYQPRGGLIQETFDRNLARRTGFARWIRQIVGPNARQRLLRRTERKLAENTPCQFLAVSEYVRFQCRKHLNLPDDRICTVFNGVDLQRLPESMDKNERIRMRSLLKIRDDQLAGIFAATNFKLKGLDVILDSVQLLHRQYPHLLSRFKFLIVGPDSPREYFEKIAALKLSDVFAFLGPTKIMGLLYHLADFLVHPTWYDPCSRVVLEALACGTPAITTQFNGASELVRQTDSGFVLDDPADQAKLMEYLVRLLDPAVCERFSRNAKALRSQISMEHHVDLLVNFYQSVLSQKVKKNGK